jgi:hypothetical protein
MGSYEAARKLVGTTAFHVASLGALWLVMVVLVDPRGNFPLDDDWSYGRSVQALVEDHHFYLTGFTAMPLVAQVIWGALFSLPAGFSFTALRLSTLVLGLAGILAIYFLLREARASRGVAFLGALGVACNPLYCLLAFTFMTDVPFVAVSSLALLFLVRGASRGRDRDLLLGVLFGGTALLIRQPALLIFVAFGVAYLATRGVSRRSVVTAVAPAAVAGAGLLAYRRLLEATIGVPVLYGRPYDPLNEAAASAFDAAGQFLDRIGVAFVYLGLFLLPLAIVVSTRRLLLLTAPLVGAVMVGLVWADKLMPLSGNIVYDEVGLGPPLLRDVYILGLPHLERAPREVWIIVTAAGVAGALLIVEQLALTILGLARRLSLAPVLGLVGLALYLVSIAIAGYLDRYLVFALPFALLCVAAPARGRWRTVAAGVVLAVYAAVSVAGTHDYLSWNRARWSALDDLTARGVSYREIDGGFEFNGWYGYDPSYRETPGKSGWWVYGDRYVLSFGPLPGFEVMARYRYRRWLPGRDTILVLRRVDTQEGAQALARRLERELRLGASPRTFAQRAAPVRVVEQAADR